MGALCLLALSLFFRLSWPKFRPTEHWIWPVLAIALPFCAGGFHTGTTAVLCLVLAAALLEQIFASGNLRILWNLPFLALLAVFAAYCITPLWAADQGMALFAIPRYLPAVLFALLLMQQKELPDQILNRIPLSGCAMTLLSLLLLPFFPEDFTVNGRLAGFFQYPNAFAAFLLVGLIWQNFRDQKWNLPISLLLITGIVLSGSRTVFVLMILSLAGLFLIRRQKKLLLLLPGLLCALGIGLLAQKFGLLAQADRFTQIDAQAGTFLVRLLYYRDVLPVIGTHPFGIGYLGYPAIEGTIQTGRYAVTYLHNGLLQLFLEIGWIPSLPLAFVLLKTLFSRNTAPNKRLMLLAILGHCMLDFDLQFAAFWILLLCAMDFSAGKVKILPSKKLPAAILAILAAVSLWLGSGDWLFRQGKVDACLALTPFHTDAMAAKLTTLKDPDELDALADQILSLQPTHSLSYSAKANAALAKGDVRSMIRHKEEAIRLSPYAAAEYLDYFQKLYWTMGQFLNMGDSESASLCREKLLQIPDMMEAVSQGTSPLAWKTGDDPTLELPEEYQQILNILLHAF